ncbi:MAG: DUF58 domain-containing protein [Phycisphaerae bacterium]|nr:DUF58 domain-containing protein [Phycisphaerae bacterium]
MSVEPASYYQLIDPKVLVKLGRLELIARQVVEGFISGKHRSPFKGFSVEFAEHREYTPGDDLRDLDWRVYARSDRYYVKQYEEETNLRAYLLVDSSGSMKYAGNGVSKHRYAQCVAATLAHLMLHQQDAVGLVTFDNAMRRHIPPRSRPSHLRVLLEEMEATQPGGETSLANVLHHVAERIRRRGLVILISDCFDDVDALTSGLHHFRHRKHEVILLHVMAREELKFPFRSWSQFRCLESPSSRVMLDPASLRDEYLRHVTAFLTELKRRCGEMEIDYVQLDTSRPYEDALVRYLAFRAAYGKSRRR